nr:MAG TPA: hypothetical protein [Caudoviricetes sp.]
MFCGRKDNTPYKLAKEVDFIPLFLAFFNKLWYNNID